MDFFAVDKFGDGWDSAYLMLYDKALNYYKYDLNCDPSFLRKSFCFDSVTSPDGDFVYATVGGFQPDQPWEVNPLLLYF